MLIVILVGRHRRQAPGAAQLCDGSLWGRTNAGRHQDRQYRATPYCYRGKLGPIIYLWLYCADKQCITLYISAIDLVILVYTNKQMLVGVYQDKCRVSDTPKSAETVISETPWRQFKNYKQIKEQHLTCFRLQLNFQYYLRCS